MCENPPEFLIKLLHLILRTVLNDEYYYLFYIKHLWPLPLTISKYLSLYSIFFKVTEHAFILATDVLQGNSTL